MKCANCGYFNIPGATICGRCRFPLSEVTTGSPDEVLPPRARDRTLRQQISANLSPATRREIKQIENTAHTVANKEIVITLERPLLLRRFPPWLPFFLSLIPGACQLYHRRYWAAGALAGNFIVLAILAFLLIHTWGFETCLYSMLCVVAASIFDGAWHEPLAAPNRNLARRVLELGLLASSVTAIAALAIVWTINARYALITLPPNSNAVHDPFKTGDTVALIQRQPGQTLHTGDMVGAHFGETGAWRFFYSDYTWGDSWGMPYLGVVVASAGDTVNACGPGLCVNGKPTKKRLGPMDLSLFQNTTRVPEDQVLISKLAGAQIYIAGQDTTATQPNLRLVPLGEIDSIPVAITSPPERRQFLTSNPPLP